MRAWFLLKIMRGICCQRLSGYGRCLNAWWRKWGPAQDRLTKLLAPRVAAIVAFDQSAHMLAQAETQLRPLPLANWQLQVAPNHQLPLADASVDLAVEGWSFGHAVGWHPNSWQDEVGRALAEMRRVLKPGGAIILLETLGTGKETPQPPTPGLAALYDRWQTEYGFNHTWIRTDYRFPSVAEMAANLRFFFGDELAAQFEQQDATTVPECTGIWWKTITA